MTEEKKGIEEMTRGRFLTYLTNYYSCSNISKYIPNASCNDQKTSDKVLMHQRGNRQEEDGGIGQKRIVEYYMVDVFFSNIMTDIYG